MADKKKNGRQPVGEKCSYAKLSDIDILDIREMYKSGVKQASLANTYRISQQQVSRIVNKKRWSHL